MELSAEDNVGGVVHEVKAVLFGLIGWEEVIVGLLVIATTLKVDLRLLQGDSRWKAMEGECTILVDVFFDAGCETCGRTGAAFGIVVRVDDIISLELLKPISLARDDPLDCEHRVTHNMTLKCRIGSFGGAHVGDFV